MLAGRGCADTIVPEAGDKVGITMRFFFASGRGWPRGPDSSLPNYSSTSTCRLRWLIRGACFILEALVSARSAGTPWILLARPPSGNFLSWPGVLPQILRGRIDEIDCFRCAAEYPQAGRLPYLRHGTPAARWSRTQKRWRRLSVVIGRLRLRRAR